MPLDPFENMPMLGGHTVAADKFLENFNELQINGRLKEYMKLSSSDILESSDGLGLSQLSPFAKLFSSLKPTKVASANANVQSKVGPGETTSYQQAAQYHPSTVAPNQAKEADFEALAELTRALDKKEGIVLELRNMDNDVLKHQKEDDVSLKDSESFRKQYAAVLVQLNEANEQIGLTDQEGSSSQSVVNPENLVLSVEAAAFLKRLNFLYVEPMTDAEGSGVHNQGKDIVLATDFHSPSLDQPVPTDMKLDDILSSLAALSQSVSSIKNSILSDSMTIDKIRNSISSSFKSITKDIQNLTSTLESNSKKLAVHFLNSADATSTRIELLQSTISKRFDYVESKLTDITFQVTSNFSLLS